MTSAKNAAFVLVASLGLLVILLSLIHARYRSPYPPITFSLTQAQTNLKDVSGVVLGFRRLAANIAWIQALQYYGTREGASQEEHFQGDGHMHTHDDAQSYPQFLAHCRHVVNIDPYFTYVYYYGGAVLGWNLNRLDEAEALLKEGIANNPKEWRLPQYLAGLAYQKNHDIKDLTRFLEVVTQDPECPLMMKALLANIYKKQRVFDKALAIWEAIYATGDPAYQKRAVHQVKEIAKLRKRPS